jgi:hypothetical protein
MVAVVDPDQSELVHLGRQVVSKSDTVLFSPHEAAGISSFGRRGHGPV